MSAFFRHPGKRCRVESAGLVHEIKSNNMSQDPGPCSGCRKQRSPGRTEKAAVVVGPLGGFDECSCAASGKHSMLEWSWLRKIGLLVASHPMSYSSRPRLGLIRSTLIPLLCIVGLRLARPCSCVRKILRCGMTSLQPKHHAGSRVMCIAITPVPGLGCKDSGAEEE